MNSDLLFARYLTQNKIIPVSPRHKKESSCHYKEAATQFALYSQFGPQSFSGLFPGSINTSSASRTDIMLKNNTQLPSPDSLLDHENSQATTTSATLICSERSFSGSENGDDFVATNPKIRLIVLLHDFNVNRKG